MTFIKKSSAPKYKDTYLKIFGLLLSITIFYLINTSPLQANTTHKIITFEVTVPTGVDASAVSLEFPKLKYNKQKIFSHICDDEYGLFNNAFNVINKKYVSNEIGINPWTGVPGWKFYFHLGETQDNYGSSGYIPTTFCEFSDGTGIKHRFASTLAAWSWKMGERDKLVGNSWPWTSPMEARLLADFGFTVGYHDLADNYSPNLNTQADFDERVATASDLFFNLIDRRPKIMIEPNGDHSYITASQNNSIIQSIVAQSGDNRIKKVYPFSNTFNLDKSQLAVQRYFDKTDENIISYLQNQTGNAREWVINGTHGIPNESYEETLWAKINKLFGYIGDDSVWVPSIDEMFEWVFMKEHATIKKEIEGQKIRFTLEIPIEDNFYFQNISVLLNGISKMDGINVTSGDNVFGTSYGISDSKLLVNLDFNESLPERSERYVSIYEKEKTKETYEDAMYFVSQLKPELKEPYTTRINTMLVPPVLSELMINNGMEKTGNSLVSISFNASKTAAYCRISESVNFENTKWIPLMTSTFFTLSSNLGNKTIYVQLKNALYESEIVSTQIDLINSEKKIVVGLSGDSKTNKKEFVNGEMLNNINPNINKGWKAVQLYDTSDNPLMKLAKDTVEIKTAMDKYGITRVSKGASSQNPLISGDKGLYPDRFINNANFFGSNIEIAPESRRLIAGFLEVPNGTYDVRILGSKNGTSTDFKNYRYQANNSEIYVPDSDIFNNNISKFIEIKNIVVNDRTLLICSWREPFGYSWGFYAPMNLIEIKPSVSTSISSVSLNENKLKIYSGKGKLIIENETLSQLNIYSIDGRLVKQIKADQNTIEILLPKGIYIVNGCKGVVF